MLLATALATACIAVRTIFSTVDAWLWIGDFGLAHERVALDDAALELIDIVTRESVACRLDVQTTANLRWKSSIYTQKDTFWSHEPYIVELRKLESFKGTSQVQTTINFFQVRECIYFRKLRVVSQRQCASQTTQFWNCQSGKLLVVGKRQSTTNFGHVGHL